MILGLNGAPQAGDEFHVLDSNKKLVKLPVNVNNYNANKAYVQKHLTLDELGRRIALGNFQELNVIVKGDVDGSIEALSDSLIKLDSKFRSMLFIKAVGSNFGIRCNVSSYI